METKCPKCGKTFPIMESNIDKKAKCSSCGEIFIITAINNSENTEIIQENINEDAEEFLQKPIIENQKNNSSNTLADLTLKPNKSSYLLFGNSTLLFWLVLLIISIILTLFNIGFIVGVILFGIISFLSYILANISYKKEKYTFLKGKIIYSYGTIFSDNTVEININKITQVIGKLGFIENKIFKTGSIKIKTAGSTSGKITIRNLDNPMGLYEEIQKRMQQNGFKLKKEHLVMESKPHMIGVLGESLKGIFVNIIIFIYIISGFLSEFDKDSLEIDNLLGGLGLFLVGGVFGVIILIFVIKFIFKYLDLKNRVYQVYDDSIFFSEGFLSKNYAFLPMESISDTENNQSFFSKILGIHDVIVSSEGSNNQVYFLNMVNGKKMMESIKQLKDMISLNTTVSNETISITQEDINENNKNQILTPKSNINYNKDFTASFSPSMLKTFILNFIFIFPIYTIPLLIINLIKAKFTSYTIGDTTFEFKYDFITTKQNSFSIDKITEVICYESILDKWLGTCSIEIFSIGSSNTLKFNNIKKTPDLFENILSKVGIYKNEKSDTLPINYNFLELIKYNIGGFIIFGILSIILLLAGIYGGDSGLIFIIGFVGLIVTLVGILIYQNIYFSKKYYTHTLFENFVESISGVIIKTIRYGTLDNVKALEVKKYPLTTTGTLSFDISGDNKEQYGNKQNQYRIVSNTIKIPFVQNCFVLIDILDNKLNNSQINKEVILERNQDIGNSVLTYIFIFPLLPIIIWYVKTKRYILETSRILMYHGIIYKNKRSILYSKIDFITHNQGFLGKIFSNGIVGIYTKGSGISDMNIVDIEKYNEVYEVLQKRVK